MPSLILASASPRRAEILTALGLTFKVVPSAYPETLPPRLSPPIAAQYLALQKAAAVSADFSSSNIIASDTLVWQQGTFFGKPRDKEDAVQMLSQLTQGKREHWVFSSLALLMLQSPEAQLKNHLPDNHEDKIYLACEKARVRFKPLTPRQIQDYVQEDESLDKAAAYAAQGKGQKLIEHLQGSFYTVMGFPVHKFLRVSKNLSWQADLGALQKKIPVPSFPI